MWEAGSQQESLKFKSHRGDIKTYYKGEKKCVKAKILPDNFFGVNYNSVLASNAQNGKNMVLPESDLHFSMKP